MESKSSTTTKALETKLAFKEKVAPKQETGAIDFDFEEEEDDDDDYPYGGRVLFKDDDGINKKKKTVAAVSGSRSGGGGVGSPCCQAEKCGADLTDAKRYHRRHKVCEVHAKAAVVEVAGLRQRFCQQCSRFHELSEFDEAKRSCRRRLAGHNERRRKGASESQNAEGSGGKEKENQCGQAEERAAGRVEINLPGTSSYKHFQIR
ncbi:hypothetical protein PVL29_025351 [Vitis rotundifolia]|uniref:SBP-type domain-containing protein n=1 Tax=Vitis rotundifolia TaxID=103349 RepID=A0AA38YJG7_VITRO|nr:hypothetical protein PVL29_025351 [Vitis rotundifolia]